MYFKGTNSKGFWMMNGAEKMPKYWLIALLFNILDHKVNMIKFISIQRCTKVSLSLVVELTVARDDHPGCCTSYFFFCRPISPSITRHFSTFSKACVSSSRWRAISLGSFIHCFTLSEYSLPPFGINFYPMVSIILSAKSNRRLCLMRWWRLST